MTVKIFGLSPPKLLFLSSSDKKWLNNIITLCNKKCTRKTFDNDCCGFMPSISNSQFVYL